MFGLTEREKILRAAMEAYPELEVARRERQTREQVEREATRHERAQAMAQREAARAKERKAEAIRRTRDLEEEAALAAPYLARKRDNEQRLAADKAREDTYSWAHSADLTAIRDLASPAWDDFLREAFDLQADALRIVPENHDETDGREDHDGNPLISQKRSTGAAVDRLWAYDRETVRLVPQMRERADVDVSAWIAERRAERARLLAGTRDPEVTYTRAGGDDGLRMGTPLWATIWTDDPRIAGPRYPKSLVGKPA